MNESADRQKERGRFSEEQIEKSRKEVQESLKKRQIHWLEKPTNNLHLI